MKTKNVKIIVSIITVIIIFAVCMVFFINKSNSIIGEWKISSFIFEGDIIPFDEYGKYYGTDNQKAYSYISITFDKNNIAIITTPSYGQNESKRIECSYNISNKIITLINEDKIIDALKIVGTTLQTLDSDFLMSGYIFEKQ